MGKRRKTGGVLLTAGKSPIEWTDATWNPATGCTKISPGCANCYAEKMAGRLHSMGKTKYRNRFAYTEHWDDAYLPLHWRKPRKIFVNSMSDMFHEGASFDFVTKCLDVMRVVDRHVYQILTKRPDRAIDYFDWYFDQPYSIRDIDGLMPRHIWLGVSVESPAYEARIDNLRNCPATTRFVSFEPLLAPMEPDMSGIDWAIIGGESGPNHRPPKYEWVRDLIDWCGRRGVPVFFKQWGGPRPKSGGRTIDGKTYDGYPGDAP